MPLLDHPWQDDPKWIRFFANRLLPPSGSLTHAARALGLFANFSPEVTSKFRTPSSLLARTTTRSQASHLTVKIEFIYHELLQQGLQPTFVFRGLGIGHEFLELALSVLKGPSLPSTVAHCPSVQRSTTGLAPSRTEVSSCCRRTSSVRSSQTCIPSGQVGPRSRVQPS